MAKLNEQGNVIARCPGCEGAQSTFEWAYMTSASAAYRRAQRETFPVSDHGRVVLRQPYGNTWQNILFLLLKCAGCGRGGMATVAMCPGFPDDEYPNNVARLVAFHPEVAPRLRLPAAVPQGIQNEFREAESCLGGECFRAAAGLFRSVLDKTMRANGYKTKGMDLYKQIEAAASDGVITESRKKRAHEDIRVLGNDVLHDEWEPIPEEAVEAAHHYAQRILEDFYDDRPTTLSLLRTKGRVPDEDKTPP